MYLILHRMVSLKVDLWLALRTLLTLRLEYEASLVGFLTWSFSSSTFALAAFPVTFSTCLVNASSSSSSSSAFIGAGARVQKAFPGTAAANEGPILETLLEQGERDPSFETFGIGDRGGPSGTLTCGFWDLFRLMQELGVERKVTVSAIDGLPQSLQW